MVFLYQIHVVLLPSVWTCLICSSFSLPSSHFDWINFDSQQSEGSCQLPMIRYLVVDSHYRLCVAAPSDDCDGIPILWSRYSPVSTGPPPIRQHTANPNHRPWRRSSPSVVISTIHARPRRLFSFFAFPSSGISRETQPKISNDRRCVPM